MAKLYFRYSAMNSGKSTAVMQAAFNYEERGMRAVIMKPAVDTKGGNTIVSRLGVSRTVDILLRNDERIEAVMQAFPDCRCLLVEKRSF